MKQFYYLTISLFLLTVINFAQQDVFKRTAQIPAVYGLYGGIIGGVDWDGDGKPEIYAVNSNAVDRDFELTPRIWKFEFNGTSWDSVWGAVMDIPLQNTWPALTSGDLDKDGNMELIWSPATFLDGTTNPNPAKVIVFEVKGDGSDVLGVDDGFGGYLPNSTFKITDQDMIDVRPRVFVVNDIDQDGTNELIFCDRVGKYHYGVLSVSDIPDNGDGTETWTIESSGLDDPAFTGTSNKWDVAVLNDVFYLFGENGLIYPVKYANNTYTPLTPQRIADLKGSFGSAQVVDINNDTKKEIVIGGWRTLDPQGAVYLLRLTAADTLESFQIADLSSLGAKRLNGGAHGDLNNDGKMDFVFGSRVGSVPNNSVYTVKYQGGDITSPGSYSIANIDSLYLWAGDDIDVIAMGNIDGDPEDEVMYSAAYTRGQANDSLMAIVVLDTKVTPVKVETDKSSAPVAFYLDQNFPNPFNPTTTIKFGLQNTAKVSLKIYNILGNEISVLIKNQNIDTGVYSYTIDASKLASGTYIYKLTYDNSVISKKMMLLK
ncbi:MAG: T9SS type A sorting domain-containing protein [Ignavibacteriales bacterium]|nr:T9SS type A sorting domain-containing protein [Ignavibacteriales bacterium]